MRERCLNPNNDNYHRYGGRGVTICDRWADFANFLADMGERPSAKYSIDRYPDKNGNYEPNNCRWATQRQQMANVSYNVMITAKGETLPMEEWARRLGTSGSTIHYRLQRGWSPEDAVTMPLLKRRRGVPWPYRFIEFA
jgi:hypothetical protein